MKNPKMQFSYIALVLRFPFSFGILGFTHSAFSMGYEAGVNNSEINGNLVPPAALITIVQKGLQYIEMEANLSDVSLVNLNLAIGWEIC